MIKYITNYGKAVISLTNPIKSGKAEYNMKNSDEVLSISAAGGVVAIVRLDDLSQALPLSEALLAGGVTALEFTLTNRAALTVIKEVKAALPAFRDGTAVIGAGSVLSAEDTVASIEAGAEFIVSPATDMNVLAVCRDHKIAAMPGAYTPTEILTAWRAGAAAVKVFPARALGPAYLKDVREPMPFLKLMPTGGVNLDNIGEYIKNGAVAVGVGGNLVDKKLVAAGDFEAIRQTAAKYIAAVRLVRG
jgi:2-dehydro-3-deoxyphosphogluconate aldolase / (4S)-4-hydroxy-2-oxoglutarate aldolase